MKPYFIVLSIVVVMLLQNCKKKKEEIEPKPQEVTVITPKKVKLELASKSGSTATGTIIFEEQEGGVVKMTAMLSGLEPGTHALHIHEKADCSSEDGTSTGGHWNPTGQPHGKWDSKQGYHKGDIGNIKADEHGNAVTYFSTNQWCLGCNDATKNILGKAIIVHAGIDDYITQPTGGAGGRVSCGAIIE